MTLFVQNRVGTGVTQNSFPYERLELAYFLRVVLVVVRINMQVEDTEAVTFIPLGLHRIQIVEVAGGGQRNTREG